ncbi:aminodeoxychorismate synthase component I [Marivirga arenosa]|uniref:Aminodeoxychorismate synthase component I n=1 Tax=Marivirga arenosa TaxID=3059076 RepID=A0AA49GE08_9BACT|nr:aminodeoxychorismate synthase component I [Marivirga sp. ABR2-2]WKK84804.2 aminodeoxychorismate synthase component I [Marivirga sp. ABR2-2]
MKEVRIKIKNDKSIWLKLLEWSKSFKYVAAFLPQQTEQYPFGAFPKCIAVGNQKLNLSAPYFKSLEEYLTDNPTHKLYGYLGYDLKNELENLKSKNESYIDWLPMQFFKAECIIEFHQGDILIKSEFAQRFKEQIEKSIEKDIDPQYHGSLVGKLKSWTSRDEYINTVKKLKNHIEEGDIYEINYCINFSVDVKDLDPFHVFNELCNNSPAPFGSFLKLDHQYIISASPERFIKLKDSKIISQPIKGTAKRGTSKNEDEFLKKQLFESEKERAENMMIVDLVRNDLAKSSESGSVKVDEIFSIYSFQQVHQMISTISSKKKKEIHPVKVIENAFPMGSMTGAPKIRAMQLIEDYENSKRNVFSGSIGYFNGLNEFDFNVLIRSIYYDEKLKKLNYEVGSAITYDADPEAEYDECLLKAKAIERTLKL